MNANDFLEYRLQAESLFLFIHKKTVMQNKLKEHLDSGVLIFDGAMGTEIYKRDFFVNTSFDELNLKAPNVISEIHQKYVDAGTDVITTNTFAANRHALSKFGLGEEVWKINAAAVKIAKKCANEDTLIAGSVGPIGQTGYNSGLTEDKIIEILADQIEALKKAGVDFIIFETIPSVADAKYAYQAINRASEIPYAMSFSVDRDGKTQKGEPLKNLLNVISDKGRQPTAVGLNCCVGPEGLLEPLEELLSRTDLPIIIQPNAGIPKQVGGRMIYMASPEYLATYALRFVNMGVKGIGGCCGTGPDHIMEIARSIKRVATVETRSPVMEIKEDAKLCNPMPTGEKSKLGAKIANGEWVTTIEIVPPRGYNLADTIAKAHQCAEAGIDAINIPDGPRASSRLSPLVSSLKIQDEAHIETILHFCCRDRNLIGMQSDLLGCAAAEVRNLLFVTGDPPKLGIYPNASAVFDADSIGMVEVQARLNQGIDLGGNPIAEKTNALIGVGADPNALDMARELRRTCEKVEAGAEYIITQPVFAVAPLLKFLDEIQKLNIPVFAGIWPLASFRNAEFMKNEVPGVVVPDTIMARMEKAETKEAQKKEGITIARESVEKISDRVQGIQISAPFGNVNTAIAVIE